MNLSMKVAADELASMSYYVKVNTAQAACMGAMAFSMQVHIPHCDRLGLCLGSQADQLQ